MMRLLTLGLLLIFLSGCKPNNDTGAAIPVTLTQPTVRPLEIIETAFGTLTSPDDPTLEASVAGRIEKIYVTTGQAVQKGQLMAKLEQHDLLALETMQQAEVKRLEALLFQQERNNQRYVALHQKNAFSMMGLEEGQAQANALKEQLIAAKAKLQLTQHDVEKSLIHAPFDAVIEKIHISTGTMVQVGSPLFHIVDPKALSVTLSLPEALSAQIKPEQKVRLTAPGAPHETLYSQVKAVKPFMHNSAHSLQAMVDVPFAPFLKPGGSIKADIIVHTHPQALMIKTQCLVWRPQGPVVFVKSGNRVKQVPITLGHTEQDEVEITMGLAVDDVIVAEGAGFLSEGATIYPVEGESLS